MRFSYIGHFASAHSTENEVLKALVGHGHNVRCFEESDSSIWNDPKLLTADCDVVLWTRTGWGYVNDETRAAMRSMLSDSPVPTVGYHLDRWWGLAREHEVYDEPYFRVNLLITADGGHHQKWKYAGVNHYWMLPAVSEYECRPGAQPDPSRFAADVAFVGSHSGYHPEATHRFELVEQLRKHGCRFFPEAGQSHVRGEDLRSLYATTKVNVGDSCLLPGDRSYISDRVPETLGRGGFLIHPAVPGVTDDTWFESRKHLVAWPMGDWERLDALIDFYVTHDTERRVIALQGQAYVLAHHTYRHRVSELTSLVRSL